MILQHTDTGKNDQTDMKATICLLQVKYTNPIASGCVYKLINPYHNRFYGTVNRQSLTTSAREFRIHGAVTLIITASRSKTVRHVLTIVGGVLSANGFAALSLEDNILCHSNEISLALFLISKNTY